MTVHLAWIRLSDAPARAGAGHTGLRSNIKTCTALVAAAEPRLGGGGEDCDTGPGPASVAQTTDDGHSVSLPAAGLRRDAPVLGRQPAFVASNLSRV